VWEVKTGKLVGTLPDPEQGPGPPTYAVAFSPDGKRLASGGLDRAVRLWDLATGKELLRLSGHTQAVGTVEFSRNGQRLLSAPGGTVRKSGISPRTKNPLNLQNDDEILLARGDLKVWDVATGKELLSVKEARAGAISPDGEVAAVEGSKGG